MNCCVLQSKLTKFTRLCVKKLNDSFEVFTYKRTEFQPESETSASALRCISPTSKLTFKNGREI